MVKIFFCLFFKFLCFFIVFQKSSFADNLLCCDFTKKYQVELGPDSKPGESSIREHSIVWHPFRNKYYLLADVIPLNSEFHPNTYNTEIHLWSSFDLLTWTYHGVAIQKGNHENEMDQFGVASPAGATLIRNRVFIPFSGRRTDKFSKRSIGLAWSSKNPELIPWTKAKMPISDLEGEDDDPALITLDHEKEMHLYHRNAGPDGYRIVHCKSMEPQLPGTWSLATSVINRPESVRAQELTGVTLINKKIHMFVIEHLYKNGVEIAHLVAENPEGPFVPFNKGTRYLSRSSQPKNIIYSGHITPVSRNGNLIAFFWTVKKSGKRYGLLGHPVNDFKPTTK